MTRNNKPHGVFIIYAITGGWVADSSIAQTRPRGDFLSLSVLHSPALQTANPAPLPVPAEPAAPRVSGGGRRNKRGPLQEGWASLGWLGVLPFRTLWGKPTSAVDVTWTHPDYCSNGDNHLQKWDRIKALTMQLHSSPFSFMHCRLWGGWISHTQLQQFVTGVIITKAFLKEKNSLRPKAEGKHGLNILILCAERVQTLPLTVKKAHEATVKSFKISKLRLVSRHDCRAFKPVTHRGTCSWTRCVWWDRREHIPWGSNTFQIWKIMVPIFFLRLPTTRRKGIAYSYRFK